MNVFLSKIYSNGSFNSNISGIFIMILVFTVVEVCS